MSPAGGIAQWLLPPLGGAAAGCGLGWVAYRLMPLLFSRGAPRVAAAVGSRVALVSELLLSLPLRRVVPASGSSGAIRLEAALADVLPAMLGSRETIYAVRTFVSGLVSRLGAVSVAEAARRLHLRDLAADRLLPLLAEEPRRGPLAHAAGSVLSDQAGTALDDEVIAQIAEVVRAALPGAAETLVRWLRSGETRAELSSRGRELLPKILQKLTDLQKLFIAAGQFDRRLDEKMPEIVDETVRALEQMVRDPQQQRRLADVFEEAARGWRDSLLVGSPEGDGSPPEAQRKLENATERLADRLLGSLQEPGIRQGLAERLLGSLESDRRSVAALVREAFGVRESDIEDMLSARVLSYLTRPETAQEVARQLGALMIGAGSGRAEATVGEFLRIDPDRKASLDLSARRAAEGWLVRRLPQELWGFIKSLRIGIAVSLLGAAIGLAVGLMVVVLRALGYQ